MWKPRVLKISFCVRRVVEWSYSVKALPLSVLLLQVLNHASALPNFDPFAGAASSLIGQADSSGNVWQGVGTQFAGPPPTVISNSLFHTNLPEAIGNSVSFVPSSGQ